MRKKKPMDSPVPASRPKTAAQIIRQIVERRHPGVGCMDGSCIFGHPGGMQTNGGCQCLKERDYPMPQRNIMVLRDVVQVLAALVAEEDVEADAQWQDLLVRAARSKVALDNVRTFTLLWRKKPHTEEFTETILRFCAEGGSVPSITRE